LSLSRPSGLLVMTMYLKYEVREVREKALSRSSDVDPRFLSDRRTPCLAMHGLKYPLSTNHSAALALAGYQA